MIKNHIRFAGLLLTLVLFVAAVPAAETREITVKLTVPDAGWAIAIDEVHMVSNEVWVISSVSRDPDMMAAQVISTVKASVDVAVPDLPVKHFVIGKTWGWKNEEPYTFLDSRSEIEQALKTGKPLYRADK